MSDDVVDGTLPFFEFVPAVDKYIFWDAERLESPAYALQFGPATSLRPKSAVLHDQQIYVRVGCIAAAGARAEEINTAGINLLNYGLHHFLNQLFRQAYQAYVLFSVPGCWL